MVKLSQEQDHIDKPPSKETRKQYYIIGTYCQWSLSDFLYQGTRKANLNSSRLYVRLMYTSRGVAYCCGAELLYCCIAVLPTS